MILKLKQSFSCKLPEKNLLFLSGLLVFTGLFPVQLPFPPDNLPPEISLVITGENPDSQQNLDLNLPAEAEISEITGKRQSLPLSCESRSAVDWASYFGIRIDEIEFFDGIPSSDNPDLGFVGDVNGSWGQIPPDPYGVHAEPVAQRLREYRLKAKAVRGMTLEEIQAEIVSGQPVITWVIGHVGFGDPEEYTSSSGAKTVVAKFEHTVVVIGYTDNKITVLDGSRIYSIYKKTFTRSWDVLGNQAVIWID
jgi:uncharacterized protein YvpB